MGVWHPSSRGRHIKNHSELWSNKKWPQVEVKLHPGGKRGKDHPVITAQPETDEHDVNTTALTAITSVPGAANLPLHPPQSPGRNVPLTPACLYAPSCTPSVCLSIVSVCLPASQTPYRHTESVMWNCTYRNILVSLVYSGFLENVVCEKPQTW